ncbi:MAG TPA: YhdP family protein [Woeseiaceae bacterium]|nr:YhdP family protein [Woeseiaceae bacterium]
MKRLLLTAIKSLAYFGAAVVILLAIGVGLFRLLLPRLPAYQEEIKQWANAAIGMEVEFSGMDARWRLSGPELTFYDAQLATEPGTPPLLHAEEVSVGVGLLRLLLDLELVADRVLIDEARVEVLEREDGGWEIQGIPLEELPDWRTGGAEGGALVVDVEDIRIDVLPAHRGRPVTFEVETARFRRGAGRHELDARVLLPQELGTELTFSATRRPVGGDPAPWRLYLEADGFRLPGLAALRPLPVEARSGSADLQLWLEVEDGIPRAVTARFGLADVRLAKAGTVEGTTTPFSATGRAEFSRDADGWLVAADELRLETPRGAWPKSSLTLAVRSGAEGVPEQVHAVASHLDFDDLDAFIALVPADWQAVLTELAPSGVVRDVDLVVHDPASPARRVEGSAAFDRAGVAARGNWPGLRGFSGEVRADPAGGRLEIDAGSLLFSFPRWFGEPIAIGEAEGTVVWRRSATGTTILSDSVRIANADISTQNSFEIVLPADGSSPVVDLQSRWSAPSVAVIGHYLPVEIMKPRLYEWLSEALVAGTVVEATTRLSGPLSAFPFDNGEGTFRTDAHIENGVLRYAPTWPAVNDIDAQLVIDGARLFSTRNSAISVGNRAVDARVEIADLRRPVLALDVQATGTLDTVHAFVNESPIANLFGGHLGRVAVEGGATFDLALRYPVLDKENYAFTATIRSGDGQVAVEGLPAPVTGVHGEVTITRETIAAEALAGEFLGSPVTFDLARAGSDLPAHSVVLRAEGSIDATALVEAFGLPGGERLAGETRYDLTVRFPRGGLEEPSPLEILVGSDLEGLAVDVPLPLGKPAEAVRPLDLRIAFVEDGRIAASGALADAARWSLDFRRGEDGWDFDRGVLAFGDTVPNGPETRGLHVTGETPLLDIDAWLALGKAGAGGGFGERIRSVDLVVHDLRVIGQRLSQHRLTVDRSAFDWVVQLEGPQVAGVVTVPYDFAGTRPIELDMRTLTLPGGGEEEAPAEEPRAERADPRRLPGLTVNAEEFTLGRRRFGSLHAVFARTPRGLEADTLETASPAFDIAGSAGWVVDESDPTGQRTWLRGRLTSRNVERTFARLDYTPGIEGESMDLTFDVSWSGGPRHDFLDSLAGSVGVRLGSGQLHEIEPGAGRVFGLMSVVALPRRLSLDFSDVFERGFGFDEITGNFRLENGQAYTCDLSLKGPAADVGIVGRAGLNDRTYEQAAVVSANVGNTLPVVGAVVAGPQVAAALLIFSQIFKKPLQEMGQVYYGIGGSWENPAIDTIDPRRFADVSGKAGCLEGAAS